MLERVLVQVPDVASLVYLFLLLISVSFSFLPASCSRHDFLTVRSPFLSLPLRLVSIRLSFTLSPSLHFASLPLLTFRNLASFGLIHYLYPRLFLDFHIFYASIILVLVLFFTYYTLFFHVTISSTFVVSFPFSFFISQRFFQCCFPRSIFLRVFPSFSV